MKTLYDAKQYLARHADGIGVSPGDTRLVDRIIDAQQALFQILADPDGMQATYRFLCFENTLVCPREIELILKAWVNDHPMRLASVYYQFLSYGPGTGDYGYNLTTPLIDEGDANPVFVQPTVWRPIFAISDQVEEDGLTILVRGVDEKGQEIFSEQNGTWLPGEQITVKNGAFIKSTANFLRITQIVKPVTKGYVRLYSFDPTTKAYQILGIYHPSDRVPGFRRYRVAGLPNDRVWSDDNYLDDTDSETTSYAVLTARCRLRYIEPQHDHDLLPVQDLLATKRMLQSMHRYDSGDPNTGYRYKLDARDLAQGNRNRKNPVKEVDVKTGIGALGARGIL